MRVLLLLSALFAALAGVASPRAQAHPVQASATALVAASVGVVASSKAQRFAVAAYPQRPPLRLAAPAPIARVATPAAYAERRRE